MEAGKSSLARGRIVINEEMSISPDPVVTKAWVPVPSPNWVRPVNASTSVVLSAPLM